MTTDAETAQRDINWQRLELRGLLNLLPAYVVIDEVLDQARKLWTENHIRQLADDLADLIDFYLEFYEDHV